MNLINRKLFLVFVTIGLLLNAGCAQKANTPEAVSRFFWEAVVRKDMESAKQLSTWDTVSYLKYLQSNQLHPERFKLGEALLGKNKAEISTTLFTTKQGKSGVKVPGTTVLVKIKQGWRVDVKKTMASVVDRTVDNVVQQLDGFFQKSINELDKTLSESLDELGKVIEDGAKELRKELSDKPLIPQRKQPKVDSQSNEYMGRPI